MKYRCIVSVAIVTVVFMTIVGVILLGLYLGGNSEICAEAALDRSSSDACFFSFHCFLCVLQTCFVFVFCCFHCVLQACSFV